MQTENFIAESSSDVNMVLPFTERNSLTSNAVAERQENSNYSRRSRRTILNDVSPLVDGEGCKSRGIYANTEFLIHKIANRSHYTLKVRVLRKQTVISSSIEGLPYKVRYVAPNVASVTEVVLAELDEMYYKL
jgi:hypothetical protein